MKNVQKNVVSGLLATVLCVTILLLPTVSAAPFSTATTGSMESMIYLSNTTSG